MPETTRRPLGERLIDSGIITREQLDLALKEQKRTNELLGQVLHDLGFISEDVLSSTLAAQSGVNHVDLNNYLIDAEILKLVPETFARNNKLIPLSQEKGSLTVAISNTFDVIAIDELQVMTGLYVEVLSATESDILNAIEQFYGVRGSAEEMFEETVRLAEPGKVGNEDTAMQAPVVRLVDQLFIKAIKNEATDIHIEPEEKIVRTRYRIDGILQQGPSLPKALQPAVITRIKIMANLNISEIRLPQDGGIRFFMGKKRIDLRVSTFPTVFGENLVLRVLDKTRLIVGLNHLGFSQEKLSIFKDLLVKPNGIILVTGPTGSGKTTTLYSALSQINSLEKSIITLEDPIEYELPVIRQSQINVKAGLTLI